MGRNGQLPAMVRHHGPQDETGMAIVVGMPVVASGQMGDTGNPNTDQLAWVIISLVKNVTRY